MKTRKKILLWVIALILVICIAAIFGFFSRQKKVKDYSSYCMDEVRNQLGEYIGNISNVYEGKNGNGAYLYKGNVSYEGVDYTYYCRVSGKDKAEAYLQEIAGNTEEIINETKNSLIIVFSPTGNTKRIATFISEINGADLNELIPVEEYTDEDRNWRNEESRTFKEFKDSSIRPEIENEFNLDGYDTIYLGYPIWFGITPNIILTLLENYDFSGKNVVLFCTSEHVGIEKSVEYLEPYNLNVIGSRRFEQGATKEEVQEWLESL